MGKLGSNPTGSGWKPPSQREHPPFGGSQKTSQIGGVHGGTAGPMHNHGGDSAGGTLPNAVTRPPNGIRTK